jgi:hypothetical protein
LSITELSIVDRPANSECKVETWKAAGLNAPTDPAVEHDHCHNEKCRSCIKRYADSQLTKVGGIDGFVRWEPRNKLSPLPAGNSGSGEGAASAARDPQVASKVDKELAKIHKSKDKIDKVISSLLNGGKIEKGLYGVRELAACYERVRDLYRMAESEAEQEGDEKESEVCPKLEEILTAMGETLRVWLDEELTEIKEGTDADSVGAAGEISMAAKDIDIEKRFGKEHVAGLTAIHKALGEAVEAHGKLAKMHKSAGALHDTIAKCHGEAMTKLAGIGFSTSASEESSEGKEPGAETHLVSDPANIGPKVAENAGLEKMLGSTLEKALKPLTDTMTKLDARLTEIEKTPSDKGVLKVVEKKDDSPVTIVKEEKIDPKDPDAGLKMIKIAHREAPRGTGGEGFSGTRE